MEADFFVRSQTGASLTVSGHQFLVFARLTLQMTAHSVRATTSDKTGTAWPLRFGYCPFADHMIVEETRTGHQELVPGGEIQTSSECSAELTTMVADGRLDAAIVTLPMTEKGLFVHPIHEERLMGCLRADGPLASAAKLPLDVIAERVCIMFTRVHQPGLYDQIHRILARASMVLTPSEFISSPAELQYLVKSGKEFSLVPESTTLNPELTMRSINGINLSVKAAFICNSTQMRPVLPMLAYRLAYARLSSCLCSPIVLPMLAYRLEKCCKAALKMDAGKRSNRRAKGDSPSAIKKTA